MATKTAEPLAAPLDPLLDAIAAAVTTRVVALLDERDFAAPKVPPPAALAQEWLPPPAAAKQLGVTVKTLEAWRSRGEGPPFSRIGNRVRYHAVDLDRWARSRSARREAA